MAFRALPGLIADFVSNWVIYSLEGARFFEEYCALLPMHSFEQREES
jgi:hypothetical protein